MSRILVVDDEPGIALVLEDSLRLEGHEVEVVTDGLLGHRRASESVFDLIMLDCTLPGRNGFDVCRDLRRAGIKTPVIFVTARAHIEDRVLGLDLGANDYVVKPFSPSEVMARVRGLLRHGAEARREHGIFEDEVRAASAVQQRLFPRLQPPVPGLDYAAVCRPAMAVSGDYYDFIPLEGGRLGLLLADVCGKGMPAALLGASLRAAIRAYAPADGLHCGEVLARANRLLYETTAPERYATAFYGVYDPAANTLTYANAGQYPPWVVRERSHVRLDTLTAPLGLFPEVPAVECVIGLHVADWLLVASDGIPEARGATDEQFGDDRLLDLLDANPAGALDLCQHTIEAVFAFSERDPKDDLTLIAARLFSHSHWP